jgi:hypothetical protein
MGIVIDKEKIIFASAEGVGNIISCLPTLITIKEVLGFEITFWRAFGNYSIPRNIFLCVDEWLIGQEIRSIDPLKYKFKLSTFWTRNYLNTTPLNQLPLLNKIVPLSTNRSEVDTYMDIARDLGVKEKDLICYPHYKEVVKLLDGFRICSVGTKDEYIEGTDDKTGLDLLTTGGIIKNCKLFIGNDSGLYHYSNTLGVKNIVLFTATSIKKNYDKRFHKYSTLIYRDDLTCRPCQGNRGWKNCKTWECRNIDPKIVANIVKEKINEN